MKELHEIQWHLDREALEAIALEALIADAVATPKDLVPQRMPPPLPPGTYKARAGIDWADLEIRTLAYVDRGYGFNYTVNTGTFANEPVTHLTVDAVRASVKAIQDDSDRKMLVGPAVPVPPKPKPHEGPSHKYMSSYLDLVYNTKTTAITLSRGVECLRLLRRHLPFEAIAFRGSSGAALAYPAGIALAPDVGLIHIRKDPGHTGTYYEGVYGVKRYVIVDDFVSEGETVAEIVHNTKANNPDAVCVAVVLYAGGLDRPTTRQLMAKSCPGAVLVYPRLLPRVMPGDSLEGLTACGDVLDYGNVSPEGIPF